MAKSRKNFAKQNGRKKACLARKDTKKKLVASKRLTRVNLNSKEKEKSVHEGLENLNINEPENDDADWTDVGTVTTGGGLRMTPQQKEKVRLLTRKQATRKTKHKARGESYSQRLAQEKRESLARRIKKKISGKAFREEIRVIKENKEQFD